MVEFQKTPENGLWAGVCLQATAPAESFCGGCDQWAVNVKFWQFWAHKIAYFRYEVICQLFLSSVCLQATVPAESVCGGCDQWAVKGKFWQFWTHKIAYFRFEVSCQVFLSKCLLAGHSASRVVLRWLWPVGKFGIAWLGTHLQATGPAHLSVCLFHCRPQCQRMVIYICAFVEPFTCTVKGIVLAHSRPSRWL